MSALEEKWHRLEKEIEELHVKTYAGESLTRDEYHGNQERIRTLQLESDAIKAKLASEFTAKLNPIGSQKKKRRLNYRSDFKRVIFSTLTQKQEAHDIEVCRSIDEQGVKCKWGRSFEAVYKDNTHRRDIEVAISKVRRDMREFGLLPPVK